MGRIVATLLVIFSFYTQANDNYQKVLNQFQTACLENVYVDCANFLMGAPETQHLLLDTLKLASLNTEFSTLYSSKYGEEAFTEFNDAFKFSTSHINLRDYTLKSASSTVIILKDIDGNALVFENTVQGWKLNVDESLSGLIVKEAIPLIRYSIGAHLSLISKIKATIPVVDVFKLGGRYFAVATYDYFDKKTQSKFDEIFASKNIDAEKHRQEMLSFYQQQSQ